MDVLGSDFEKNQIFIHQNCLKNINCLRNVGQMRFPFFLSAAERNNSCLNIGTVDFAKYLNHSCFSNT